MRAVALGALRAGCAAAPSSEPPGDAAPSETPAWTVEGVDWTLGWDLDGTERVADGRRFTTDLGYDVTLEAGVVVTSALTLAPCEPATVAWHELLGVGTARAHHGEFCDPSLIELQVGEDLVDPVERAVAARFEPGTYCGVHWSIARPDPGRRGIDGNPKPRNSLGLRGTWTRGEEVGAFAWTTDWADGRGREFAGGADGGVIAARIERPVASLLDGIDLARATEDQAMWATLENLVAGYRADVGGPID